MPTYTPLQSIVLTSPTSSVTFASIPQNYTDLVIVSNLKITTAGFGLVTQFNSDTAGRYSLTNLYGDGTVAGSARTSNTSSITLTYNVGIPTAVGTFGTAITNIMNYSNSTTFKTVLNRYSNGSTSNSPGTEATVGLWRDTPAIHTIILQQNTGSNNLDTGSTFDLYGISPAAADTAQAFGGTEIIYTNSHVIHVFKASGTFTPYRNLTADYLVVAGGGGGGGIIGGGGGAGGLRCTVDATGGSGSLESTLSLTGGTTYTVTVGAGGAGGSAAGVAGTAGQNSVFSTITSTGGGGGGRLGAGNGGGSGGGGHHTSNAGGARTASPVQGNNGGAGAFNELGGGGGGAGAVGNTASGSAGAAGGNGATTSISGVSTIYAGGGGGSGFQSGPGGAGGTGGGGTGGRYNPQVAGTNGTTNLGGGGGGGGDTAGYNGGSGIVIVRYAR